jgi:hypothetical protein
MGDFVYKTVTDNFATNVAAANAMWSVYTPKDFAIDSIFDWAAEWIYKWHKSQTFKQRRTIKLLMIYDEYWLINFTAHEENIE